LPCRNLWKNEIDRVHDTRPSHRLDSLFRRAHAYRKRLLTKHVLPEPCRFLDDGRLLSRGHGNTYSVNLTLGEERTPIAVRCRNTQVLGHRRSPPRVATSQR
jgi:hypothetical protein